MTGGGGEVAAAPGTTFRSMNYGFLLICSKERRTEQHDFHFHARNATKTKKIFSAMTEMYTINRPYTEFVTVLYSRENNRTVCRRLGINSDLGDYFFFPLFNTSLSLHLSTPFFSLSYSLYFSSHYFTTLTSPPLLFSDVPPLSSRLLSPEVLYVLGKTEITDFLMGL
jgi:hypothetical protein